MSSVSNGPSRTGSRGRLSRVSVRTESNTAVKKLTSATKQTRKSTKNNGDALKAKEEEYLWESSRYLNHICVCLFICWFEFLTLLSVFHMLTAFSNLCPCRRLNAELEAKTSELVKEAEELIVRMNYRIGHTFSSVYALYYSWMMVQFYPNHIIGGAFL